MKIEIPARPQCHFKAEKLKFSLFRVTDEEYLELRSRSFPIKYNSLFKFFLSERDEGEDLNLPKWLILLEKKFGRSSKAYDSWKQGFSFPFLLQIEKHSENFYYLLKIEDYRGDLEFRLYRVIDNINYLEKDTQFSNDPILEELSEKEIKYLICYVWGYYKGYAESYFASNPHITPFYRHIQTKNLVYGYWENKFVELMFEDDNDCTQFLDELDKKYGEQSMSDKDKVCIVREKIHMIVD